MIPNLKEIWISLDLLHPCVHFQTLFRGCLVITLETQKHRNSCCRLSNRNHNWGWCWWWGRQVWWGPASSLTITISSVRSTMSATNSFHFSGFVFINVSVYSYLSTLISPLVVQLSVCPYCLNVPYYCCPETELSSTKQTLLTLWSLDWLILLKWFVKWTHQCLKSIW